MITYIDDVIDIPKNHLEPWMKVRQIAFELEVSYDEIDTSFSHEFGVKTQSRKVVEYINGNISLLDEDGETLSTLDYDEICKPQYDWNPFVKMLINEADSLAQKAVM